MHLGRAHHVPETVVAQQLRLAEGRLFQLCDGLVDFWVLQEFFRHFAGLFVNLREVTEPEYLHPFVVVGFGREFRQFDEHEAQPLDDLFGLGFFHDFEVVVVAFAFGERVVDEVQGVYRLQELVVSALLQLADVRFRGVEQYALLVGRGPHHLHFHDELPSGMVLAAHVHDAVLAQGVLRDEFRIQVFHPSDFLFRGLERQQGVQETDDQVGMFAEHFFESEVGLRVQVSHASSV